MALWRYCPVCYRLADKASILKRCPFCTGNPKALLQVLPLDADAAQAAIRVGGRKALEEMIVGLVAGEDAAQAYEAETELEWELRVYSQLDVRRPRRVK